MLDSMIQRHGGSHWLTVDTTQDGPKQDYWLKRDSNGIYRYGTNTH